MATKSVDGVAGGGGSKLQPRKQGPLGEFFVMLILLHLAAGVSFLTWLLVGHCCSSRHWILSGWGHVMPS